MKTMRVQIDGRTSSEVRLNNYDEFMELTPTMARSAVQIAAGLGAWGVVSDGHRSYRVTKIVRTCYTIVRVKERRDTQEARDGRRKQIQSDLHSNPQEEQA